MAQQNRNTVGGYRIFWDIRLSIELGWRKVKVRKGSNLNFETLKLCNFKLQNLYSGVPLRVGLSATMPVWSWLLTNKATPGISAAIPHASLTTSSQHYQPPNKLSSGCHTKPVYLQSIILSNYYLPFDFRLITTDYLLVTLSPSHLLLSYSLTVINKKKVLTTFL